MSKGLRLLVVERNALLLMDLSEVLREAGYEVLEAGDGVEALQLLDDPDSIDLVITSIVLDGVDGFELAHRARTDGKPVPTIFTSGHGKLSDAQAHPPARSHRLAKPISLPKLQEAIDDLLERPFD